MKRDSEQFEIDFNRELTLEEKLQRQWKENEAQQAKDWTPEAMCIWWAFYGDKESFKALPGYKQREWINRYEQEQHRADVGKRRITAPNVLLDQENERFNLALERAKRLANVLAADWSAGRAPSEFTYDPFIAHLASDILGRPVEAICPPDPDEVKDDGTIVRKRPARKQTFLGYAASQL